MRVPNAFKATRMSHLTCHGLFVKHVGILVSIALCTTLTTAAFAVPGDREVWIRAHSASFSIVSNADRWIVESILEKLEMFRAALLVIEGLEADTGRGVPATVIVFNTDRYFDRYRRNAAGQRLDYAGIFRESRDGVYIGLSTYRLSEAYTTVFHEYVHWVFSQKSFSLPRWLNEATAVFYSQLRFEKTTVHLGEPPGGYIHRLRTGDFIPMGELLAARNPHLSERDPAPPLFYPQSWLLYHYLRFGKPELWPRLAHFLHSMNTIAARNVADSTKAALTRDAWEDAFGLTYEQTELELRKYMQRDKFEAHVVELGTFQVEAAVTVEPLSYSETLFYLGDYLAHVTDRFEDARDHLSKAVTLSKKHARARTALASVLLDLDELEKAQRHFERAVEFAGDEEEPYFRYGMFKVMDVMFDDRHAHTLPAVLPAKLLEARQLFERCVELNPERAEAFFGLGATYVWDPGDVAAGIAALQHARGLMPGHVLATFYLARLYLRIGELEIAEGLVDRVLIHVEHPELLEVARRMIEQHRDPETQYASVSSIVVMGEKLHGGIEGRDKIIESPILCGRKYALATRGKAFRVVIEQPGTYVFDLRSHAFDAYLILRQTQGAILAEDDDGGIGFSARLDRDLRVGVYILEAAALHGQRGDFILSLKRRPTDAPNALDTEIKESQRYVARLQDTNARPVEIPFALRDLADLHWRAKDLESAELMYLRALEFFERSTDPLHAEIAISLEKLADLYNAKGNIAEARRFDRRAEIARKRASRSGH